MTISHDDMRLLRIDDVLEIIPIGKSTWWQGVKNGLFPAPIKLGGKATFWKSQDIYNLINQSEANYAN